MSRGLLIFVAIGVVMALVAFFALAAANHHWF